MKKTYIIFLVLAGVIFLNWKFHIYSRLFNAKEFYFVTKRGTEFFLEGEPFRFVGANTRLIHGNKERGMVAEALQNAKKTGIRVIRQWAVGECENDSTAKHNPINKYYFQAGPNNWIEESFVHFDSLLVAAAQNDIKVMITLFNNWTYYGGMPMYLKWTGMSKDSIAQRHDDFYTDPQIDKWVTSYINKMVLRKNSITGVLYRDDPTIFSWELVNESRATADNYQDLITWTKNKAEYIKSIDPTHLTSTSMVLVDNALERNQILDVFEPKVIDYVDIHAYPAEHWWETYLPDREHLSQMIDDFTQIAHFALHKPLVIGEFGFRRGETWLGKQRHELFASVFDRSFENGIAGIMPWSYSDPAWEADYEINWREPEHAQICSVIAVYASKFAEENGAQANPNIGQKFGLSMRVHSVEQEFTPDTLYPAFISSSEIKYEMPITSYSKAKWTSFGSSDKGRDYAFVFGKDQGYFTYEFYTADGHDISAIKFKARLSSNYPPVTDETLAWTSDITISINEVELGTLSIKPEKQLGAVYELSLSANPNRPLFALNAGLNRLKLELKEDATNRNGLEIFGEATTLEYKADELPIQLEFSKLEGGHASSRLYGF